MPSTEPVMTPPSMKALSGGQHGRFVGCIGAVHDRVRAGGGGAGGHCGGDEASLDDALVDLAVQAAPDVMSMTSVAAMPSLTSV